MKLEKRTIPIYLNFPYSFDPLYSEVANIDPNNRKKIKIYIDLTEIKFIRPNTALAIAECLIALKKKNVEFSFIPPKAIESKKYFQDIGLEEFCRKNWVSCLPYEFKPSKSFIPIQRIIASQIVQYIEEVKKYYLKHFPTKDVSSVGILISEIVNNIYDHSEDEAYCFLQYSPKTKELLFVANDHGIGIVEKVKEYKENKGLLNLELANLNFDIDFFKWATKLGNSTHSKPNNGGKGLDNIINSVKNTKGSELRIYTNTCLFQINREGNLGWYDNPLKNYIGTSIELVLKIDNLPDKDEEDFDFNF